jgi:hypothetical protein
MRWIENESEGDVRAFRACNYFALSVLTSVSVVCSILWGLERLGPAMTIFTACMIAATVGYCPVFIAVLAACERRLQAIRDEDDEYRERTRRRERAWLDEHEPFGGGEEQDLGELKALLQEEVGDLAPVKYTEEGGFKGDLCLPPHWT